MITIHDLLQTAFGACFLCVLLFGLIGIVLLTVLYIVRFHQRNDHSERKFLRSIVMMLALSGFSILAGVSYAVSVDGLHWLYWQWVNGLVIVILLGIVVWLSGHYMAKTKGDPTKYL
jgi:hypothetical protein